VRQIVKEKTIKKLMIQISEIIPPQSVSYEEYLREVNEMVEKKATSGPNQSDSLVQYTYLNSRRMKRLNKTIKLDEEIVNAVQRIDKTMAWVVITEAWCGDAAQNLPYISALANSTEKVDLRLVYRDQNEEFMSNYLTNGAKSIPKLVGFDIETGEELFVWGPRPQPVQEMVMEYKDKMGEDKLPFDKFSEEVHRWYSLDKNATLRAELLHIFRSIVH
jgi:hypothetical protein